MRTSGIFALAMLSLGSAGLGTQVALAKPSTTGTPVAAAAKPGNRCEDIDIAARGVINGAGFGPGYATPGLPHRTGHGIGLDVHEWPYLVKGDRTVLKPGMTFSNEPTICIYGEFGVRLEDHMVITETGARWFTQPAHSVDDPFGLER